MDSWGFVRAESGYFLSSFPTSSFKQLRCCFTQGVKLRQKLRAMKACFVLVVKEPAGLGELLCFAGHRRGGLRGAGTCSRTSQHPAAAFLAPTWV